MRYTLLIVLIAFAAACAGTTSGGGQSGGRSDLITAEEIAGSGARNAYEAVEQLRPQWLRSRGAVSTQDAVPQLPQAYLDNFQLADLERLRTIGAPEIREIRFIDGRSAVNRYGADHGGGVIQVIAKG
jgi:hypothetical protein